MKPDLIQHLRELPAVRSLAERMAQERYTLERTENCVAVATYMRMTSYQVDVATELRLLTDTSRPASMDALARLLAEAVGMKCEATAPRWAQRYDWYWSLARIAFVENEDEAEQVKWTGLYDRSVIAPGIAAITDPGEALVWALLHHRGEK